MTARKMTKDHTPSPTSVYGQPVRGPHTVAVAFGAWTAQAVRLNASGGGGRQDLPYIAVTVGHLLTYVYDRVALSAYLRAWRLAVTQNNSVRLPTAVASASGPSGARSAETDVSVVCNVIGRQRVAVVADTAPDGSRSLNVVIGAVTIRVHTSTALESYVLAWTRAESFAGILDDPNDDAD